MNFIRRSDGTTIYGGSHVTVRSWRAGGIQNSVSAEDRAWEQQVLAACTELRESFNWRNDDPMDSGNIELGLVVQLFGQYKRPELDNFMPEMGCFRRE